MAARTMGFRTVVLDPDPEAPAGRVADDHLVAAFDDEAALDALGARCDAVTVEFENPPSWSLARLAAETRVAPSARAVAVCQDRRLEKRFLADAGFPAGPFHVADDLAGLRAAPPWFDGPCVVKTARLGYDGKGQRRASGAAAVAEAWHDLGGVPCVVEALLPLEVEVSVVVARGADGSTAAFDVAENHHVDGILDLSVVPARIPPSVAADAQALAVSIAGALGYVGVLGVEMFVVGGRLLVNEVAPRPHNSGHWTLDGAATSQFEQQVRSVCGLGLGDPVRTVGAAAMVNLLGERWAGGEPLWERALAAPGAHLHLYGKRTPRPGRKMGHLTVCAATPDDAAAGALALRRALTPPAG
jgi:5-(carboxyamino)imidazole ribonucleotide synthase